MRKVVFLLLAVCLLIPFGLASADDPAVGSKEDNACNTGGTLAGKCSTEQDWTCGWYIARFEAKTFSRAQVPALCAGLLPGAGIAGGVESTNTRETTYCNTVTPPDPFPGEIDCIQGNTLYVDVNGDSITDARFLIGSSTTCPSGTIPSIYRVGTVPPKQLEIFLNSLGFSDDQILCG